MSKYKSFFSCLSLLLILCLLFNLIGASGAFAAPEEAQRVPQKNNLVADIGEIPNKLPKEKLELTSKRTKYSTRFLNPDGSFTEEIFLEPKFYQDPADKKWKNIDNSLKANNSGKYENGSNDFNAIFADNAEQGDLVTVEKDGKSLGLSLYRQTMSQAQLTKTKSLTPDCSRIRMSVTR